MSRTLGRLRRALADPLLVRAGRGLVPTPRALELSRDVHALVQQGRTLLTPGGAPELGTLTRQFSLQANDMFLAGLAAPLIEAVRKQAPGVALRFLPESLEDTPALREGRLDLEIGAIQHTDPETRVEPLATGHLLGVVRPQHPLATGKATLRKFVAADHISVSRRGRLHGPIDERLAERGLERRVVAVVPNYTTALLMVREADLVCLTPTVLGRGSTEALGLHSFEIPLEVPEVTMGMAWHPRHDADGAHRWLRDRVREVVTVLIDNGS